MKQVLIYIIVLPLLLVAAEWQSLNGPPSGRADDLSVGWDPINSYWAIYAADQTQKLYKSTNDGEYWDSITNSNASNASCVITYPNRADTVFIGKWSNPPIWISTNGGGSWFQRSNGINNNQPFCFCIDPIDNNMIFMGCNGYPWLFRSTNNGQQWASIPHIVYEDYGRIKSIASIRDEEDLILLIAYDNGISQGIYRSTDFGSNWDLCESGGFCTITFQNTQVAYAGMNGTWQNKGIYKSNNGGQTWTHLINSPEYIIYDIICADQNTIIAATSCGIYKSTGMLTI